MKLPNQILIGLGYQSGVGKSSIAHYLVDHYDFVRMSIAGCLKSTASTLLGMPCDTPEFKTDILCRSTGREFLQKLAEFIRHELGDNYFIANMGLRTQIQYHPRIVIDDVRFASEVFYIHRIGGKCFKIVRPNHIRRSEDLECTWSGKDAQWKSTIRNVDIPFAADTLMRIVAGEEQEDIQHSDPIYVPPRIVADPPILRRD